MSPGGGIHHYKYTIDPPVKSRDEEHYVLETLWGQLQKELGTFVFQCPCHIFSPREMSNKVFEAKANEQRGFEAHKLSIEFLQNFTPDQVNSGLRGEYEVVFRHIAKKLAKQVMEHKVGRRYYECGDVTEGKGQIPIFAGFYASMCNPSRSSPRLAIDTAYRAQQMLKKKNNVLETIVETFFLSQSGNPLAIQDPEVQAAWLQKCLGATVVTGYNNRQYRIKAVLFDKNPTEEFMCIQREKRKEKKKMSIVEYMKSYYQREISELKQPLLEAVPERKREKVYLVPELCNFTGYNEEMRKEKSVIQEALKQSKVTPPERLGAIQALADVMAARSAPGETKPAARLMQEWKVKLDPKPMEVKGRIFDPVKIYFTNKDKDTGKEPDKGHVTEDGNFQKSMRNGLRCPRKLDNWLFICPPDDAPVVSVWLRSIRDIAQVAFGVAISEPEKCEIDNQKENLLKTLEEKVTPATQLVLLLTPHKDSSFVYKLFKQATCTSLPCITQVVKSETTRRRQSIAAVLSRIALQFNAKLCGPLWEVDLRCEQTAPAYTRPTMVVGVDVFRSREGDLYMGFVAAIDPSCTEYYSMSYKLDRGDESGSMSVRIQEAIRDALVHFLKWNEDVLPEHVLVYRGSLNQQDWATIKTTEIEAIQEVLSAVARSAASSSTAGSSRSGQDPREAFEPKLTFVAVAKRTNMRFFLPASQAVAREGREGLANVTNVKAGTVVDCPEVTMRDVPSFFLVSQMLNKGTAMPSEFAVLHDSGDLSMDALQQLTYRLAFLYYNCTSSVRVPAPLQYAKKIAHFIGSAVKCEPHERLRRTLFYL